MKKLLIALVGALALTGMVYGAAASMGVTGVQNIGSGSDDVTSPSTINSVTWQVDSGDISNVNQIDVTFDGPAAASTLHIQVVKNDGAGAVNCTGPTIGTITNGSNVYSANTPVAALATSATFNGALTIPAADIDYVNATMTTP